MNARVALGVFAFCMAAYFVLRFQGLWSENDTAAFSQMIAAVQQAGSIDVPHAYPHGYAYQSLAASLLNLTGMSLASFLQRFGPILGALMLVLFAYVTYSRLMVSRTLALLASSVLFLVPEVLFTVIRGNHEKFTVSLTLLAGFLVVRLLDALKRRTGCKSIIAWGLAYLLCLYSLDTLNLFFGSIFLSTFTLCALTLMMLNRPLHLRISRDVLRALGLMVSSGWLLVIVVVTVVYPPARGNFSLLASAAEKLTGLLTYNTPAFNPYTAITSDWSSPWLYQLITAFRWVLMGSAVVGSALELRDIAKNSVPPTLTQLLLVGLFIASIVLLAGSVVVDLLGLAAGSNLEVRVYTYVILWASPIAVRLVTRLGRVSGANFSGKLVQGALMVVFGLLVVASLLKSSLDPVLSNRWLGYHPAEVQALRTWSTLSEGNTLWIGYEPRLAFAYAMTQSASLPRGNRLSAGPALKVQAAYALHSPLADANNRVWQVPLPAVLLGDQIYDNGEVQIVWRHPATPFQR